MKTFILKLFCFMLIVSTALFIGTACKNEEDAVSQGLEFESSSDNTGYAVAGIGDCFDNKIIIPSTYNDKPVVEIKEEAFKGDNLTSVTIPNSVTSIGNSAFFLCHNLKSVTIGNSVTNIGDDAFRRCPIKTATIPATAIEAIKNKSLKRVTLTGGKSIGSNAFSHCDNLTSVTIPNSVTSIGSSAFEGCTSLTSITIPNSVTSIGSYVFSRCDNLTSITIGNSVTSIGKFAFLNCNNLTSITYNGTKSEWNSISKVYNWKHNIPATYVTCADGTVNI